MRGDPPLIDCARGAEYGLSAVGVIRGKQPFAMPLKSAVRKAGGALSL